MKLGPHNSVPVRATFDAAAADDWSYAAAAGGIVNTADVLLAAAAGAGMRNLLSRLDIVNTNAAVDTEVVIKDGSTVIWRREFKANGVAALAMQFSPPLKGSADTALNVACVTTGAKVYVNAGGRRAAVS